MASVSHKTIGVVGAGQMGSGIAQVFAQLPDVSVVLVDAASASLALAKTRIADSLDRLAKKQPSIEPALCLQRITMTTALTELQAVELVVEAIVEDETAKCQLLQALDGIVHPAALFASNTSSISITRLAKATQRPSQVAGMHFMNPVPVMPLVELIKGAQTATTTVDTLTHWVERLGKTPVVSQDFPGFISNRVLMPLINEAIYALHEGVGSAEAIDTVMKLGMNHPMGPLQLADFIGLDTVLAILTILQNGYGEGRFRPCPLLKQYVDAGYLGKKSGRGFYTY
jgi:3-hydroxybutyryl-CoA dehydrogenase